MRTSLLTKNSQNPLLDRRKSSARRDKKSSSFDDMMSQAGEAKKLAQSRRKKLAQAKKSRPGNEVYESYEQKPLAKKVKPRKNPQASVAEVGGKSLGEKVQGLTAEQRQQVKTINSQLLKLQSSLGGIQNALQQNSEDSAIQTEVTAPVASLQSVSEGKSEAPLTNNLSAEMSAAGVQNAVEGKELDQSQLQNNSLQQSRFEESMQKLLQKAKNEMKKTDLKIGTEPLAMQANGPGSMIKEMAKASENPESSQVIAAMDGVKEPMKMVESSGQDVAGDLIGFENFLADGQAVETNGDGGSEVEFTQAMKAAEDSSENKDIDNMKSVVRQVRTFVKDGGGSMNIELSPEGMGRLKLNVAVENGQVNVEMLADNNAAKKALEEGLGEMRNSLEGQKLIVDNLKVELSKDYERDFTQHQNMAQEQENREFAQQFMQQFQQGKEERMASLFDGFRSYIKTTGGPELSLQARPTYFDENKGRSVNLIA